MTDHTLEQIRGNVLRVVREHEPATFGEIRRVLTGYDERTIDRALQALRRQKAITFSRSEWKWRIA